MAKNYAALKTELQKPEYEGLTDAEILGILNAPGAARVSRGVVPAAQFLGDLVQVGATLAIRALPDETPQPEGVPLTAAQLKALLEDLRYIQEVVTDNATVVAWMQVGMAYGVITEEQIDFLTLTPVSLAETMLGRGVEATADDLLNARNGEWE